MDRFRQIGAAMRPYDPLPTEPDEICRVQMARSAKTWRADIEALLVENEMPIECADTVIGMVDKLGYSIRGAVEALKPLLLGP